MTTRELDCWFCGGKGLFVENDVFAIYECPEDGCRWRSIPAPAESEYRIMVSREAYISREWDVDLVDFTRGKRALSCPA